MIKMKVNWNAYCLLRQAFENAIHKGDEKIRELGALTHPDTKISPDARSYFETQLVEMKAAQQQLRAAISQFEHD